MCGASLPPADRAGYWTLVLSIVSECTRPTPTFPRGGGPTGEGVYAISRHNNYTHLAYVLELPPVPGPVQQAFQILPRAYVVAVRNPRTDSNVGLDPARRAKLPGPLQDRFRGRHFIPLDPADYLDHEGHRDPPGRDPGRRPDRARHRTRAGARRPGDGGDLHRPGWSNRSIRSSPSPRANWREIRAAGIAGPGFAARAWLRPRCDQGPIDIWADFSHCADHGRTLADGRGTWWQGSAIQIEAGKAAAQEVDVTVSFTEGGAWKAMNGASGTSWLVGNKVVLDGRYPGGDRIRYTLKERQNADGTRELWGLAEASFGGASVSLKRSP